MSASSAERSIRFDVFELRPESAELFKAGRKLKLKPQAVRVLSVLAGRAGEAVSREEIRRSIWGDGTFVDFERSLNSCVTQVRAALGDDALAPRFIETIPRHGYRFVGVVEPPAEPVAPAVTRPGSVFTAVKAVALVLALSLLGVVGWTIARRARAAPTARPAHRAMLLVLPLENLGGNPDEDDFGEGLAEEIITRTAAIAPERLGVYARTTAARFRRRKVDEEATGALAALAPDYVLEGSYRRDDDRHRIRITARLVSGKDQSTIWTEELDRADKDVLDLESEVASRVARALTLGAEGYRPELPPDTGSTEIAAAHDAYLRGRNALAEMSAPGIARAVRSFEAALELDPRYARAWAGLADAENFASWFAGVSPEESARRARKAVSRALELAPELADAQDAAGFLALYRDFDFPEADKRFRRAIELQPGLAMPHYWYAALLSVTGRHQEAVASIRRAQELDPLSPLVNADAGWYYFYARRYDDAVRECRRILEVSPDYAWAQHCVVAAEIRAGRDEEARKDLSTYAALVDAPPDVRSAVAAAATLIEARGTLARWLLDGARRPSRDEGGYVSPYVTAILELELGNRNDALGALERAYAERDGFVVRAATDPRLDPLGDEPRFQALLRSLGLASSKTSATIPSPGPTDDPSEAPRPSRAQRRVHRATAPESSLR